MSLSTEKQTPSLTAIQDSLELELDTLQRALHQHVRPLTIQQKTLAETVTRRPDVTSKTSTQEIPVENLQEAFNPLSILDKKERESMAGSGDYFSWLRNGEDLSLTSENSIVIAYYSPGTVIDNKTVRTPAGTAPIMERGKFIHTALGTIQIINPSGDQKKLNELISHILQLKTPKDLLDPLIAGESSLPQKLRDNGLPEGLMLAGAENDKKLTDLLAARGVQHSVLFRKIQHMLRLEQLRQNRAGRSNENRRNKLTQATSYVTIFDVEVAKLARQLRERPESLHSLSVPATPASV